MTAQKPYTSKLCTGLVAGLLAFTSATTALGQIDPMYVADSSHDLQFFSPVDLDFENNPLRKDSGYFFRYDKLSWAYTGERVMVGDPTQVVFSENIFGNSPSSQGAPPQQYQIINGLQDVPPDADFAWGERYEMGQTSGGNGWLVGILDGPEVKTAATYGFQNLTIPNSLPLASNNDPNFSGANFTINGATITGSADLSTSRSGFGSVHVNFATAPGFLLGFRDYHINGPNNEQGPTIGGPGRQVTAQVIANNQITDITLTTGADGLTDDLDGDLLNGFFFVQIDSDGDGTLDTTVANGVDFGDLHLFNVRFDTFAVRNVTETQGIEIMRTLELNNRHLPVNRQGNRMNIAYGVRYLRLKDAFFFEGKGDLLGRTFADTSAQNSIVGPQIRAKWSSQRGRLNLDIDGRFVFGYNVQDLDQVGAIGEDLIPGGLNSSAIGQPTAFSYGRRDDNFTPVVEFRAESSYQLTSSIAAKLGYTAIFVDNISRASQTVRWYLPDMGLLSGGEQDIFINGVNFGFDVVY